MSETTTTPDATSSSAPSDRCPLCGHAWSRHLRGHGCQDLKPGSYPCGCSATPPAAEPATQPAA